MGWDGTPRPSWMQGRRDVIAVVRRWIPEGAAARHARLAISINLSSLALAVGLYALIRPPADWHDVGLLFAPFYFGFRPRQLARSEFVELAPAFLSMLALGVVVWLLIQPLGVFALAPLALVVVAPQIAIARLARPRLVSTLSVAEA